MKGLATIVMAALLSACAPQADPNAVNGFRQSVATGNFQAASLIAQQQAQLGTAPELMWSLNTGATALHAGDNALAIRSLDAAEELMRASDVANFSWGRTYRFGTYDAVMVNAYKAMANLGRNDPAGARVELNRMEERQRITTERFQREISSAIAEADDKARSDQSNAAALRNAQNAPEVRAQQQVLDVYRAYQPFVNPAGSYLRAIYLLNSQEPGDAEQARAAFQRVAAIANNPRVVREDAALAQRAASGQRGGRNVWVIFENGQSPIFDQLNFTVPMPVLARGGGVTIRPVTVSMPRMLFQPVAYERIEVTAGNGRHMTETVANIEAVMASEFRTRYPALLSAAVFEALAKAAGISAVNAAASRMGTAGLLLDLAATAAANVTSSDTRSWYVLPREVQATRFAVPADGRVVLRAPGGQSATVTVPTDRGSIILVKAQSPGSPLIAQVHRL